ncbi:MAG TPA: homocysteine S-methyltransferase family protein, partial [Candidatus Binatia bacterium]|nr:homocysteine S-methyltransferase family protein [Candidatus Binatia bacterium]
MNREQRLAAMNAELAKRILVLDGSMGAYLQGFGLTSGDFHGQRFANHKTPLKGDSDVLTLTRPAIITKVHEAYIAAGADIVSTNTFTATPISQAEYGLEAHVREMNVDGARLAREACDRAEAADGKPRAVAGSLGPTTKLLSMSPDVGDPGRRDATFELMAAGYKEQALGLIEGGADFLLIETITDTLNAKSAL